MKKYFISICIASFLISCSNVDDKKDVKSYVNRATRLYQERPEDTAAIAELLTEGLAKHPDNIRLLQSRADLFCGRGILPECRADTRRLLELKPNMIEAHMMLCMLDEFEGVDKNIYEACYNKVVDLYKEFPQRPTIDKEIAHRFNYVFALLMANSPTAEKEKTNFLEIVESEPQARIYQGTLNNFDRKRALRGIFGKEQ